MFSLERLVVDADNSLRAITLPELSYPPTVSYSLDLTLGALRDSRFGLVLKKESRDHLQKSEFLLNWAQASMLQILIDSVVHLRRNSPIWHVGDKSEQIVSLQT